jgi:hypothetical protein
MSSEETTVSDVQILVGDIEQENTLVGSLMTLIAGVPALVAKDIADALAAAGVDNATIDAAVQKADVTVKANIQTLAAAVQAGIPTIAPAPPAPPSPPATLTLSSPTPPGATVGQPYSLGLQTSGGTGNITVAAKSGALPDGLTIDATNEISGTPGTAGTFDVVFEATDSGTPPQVVDYSLEIVVAAPAAA